MPDTKIKIDRAVFPLLHAPKPKNIAYTHNYSIAQGASPSEPATALMENQFAYWMDANGLLVLEAPNNGTTDYRTHNWTVSNAEVWTDRGTNESTAIPPPTDSVRYIRNWGMRARSYDDSGTVSFSYSAVQRAVSLDQCEVLGDYQATRMETPTTSPVSATFTTFYDPRTGEPRYTSYMMTYWRLKWTVEVWERIDGAYYMHLEQREQYVSATSNRYFSHAVPLDPKPAFGDNSYDVITETESS